ncbi:MAG: hypothetical protein DSZ05_05135 [Sulfurospirillum sp.]|nr:MAG: hypothetical protein DSZ05_05135 [Sulfurospirillum sp.]
MRYYNRREAFTMLELIFVIVIIAILAAVAVPKFTATRDDATITKAISTVSAVRKRTSGIMCRSCLALHWRRIEVLPGQKYRVQRRTP